MPTLQRDAFKKMYARAMVMFGFPSDQSAGDPIPLQCDPTTGALLTLTTISGNLSLPGNLTVNLDQVGGGNISLGQKAMAASLPVVLASDQASIPVNVAGNLTSGGNVTVIGPLGAATTTAASISVVANGAGVETSANSTSVVPASDATFTIAGNLTSGGNVTVIGPLGAATSVAASISVVANGAGIETAANSTSIVPASDATFTVTGNVTTSSGKVATFSTQSTISVGTTATVLLAINAGRVGYALTGNGATDSYHGNASVVSGATAQANGGARLGGSGGQWVLSGFTGAVSGITAAGTEITSVIEW